MKSTESMMWFQKVGKPLEVSSLCSDLNIVDNGKMLMIHEDSLSAANAGVMAWIFCPPVSPSECSIIAVSLGYIELLR